MPVHETWVERQIREAMERGEFDNLGGAGRPLHVHDADDPDWWVKRFLEREGLDASATMPPVMQLRAEHATFPSSLVDVTREEHVREILQDYNRRVVEDRLRPAVGRAMPAVAPRVDIDEMVGRWRELRDQARAVEAAPVAVPDSPTTSRERWWHLRRFRRRPR